MAEDNFTERFKELLAEAGFKPTSVDLQEQFPEKLGGIISERSREGFFDSYMVLPKELVDYGRGYVLYVRGGLVSSD